MGLNLPGLSRRLAHAECHHQSGAATPTTTTSEYRSCENEHGFNARCGSQLLHDGRHGIGTQNHAHGFQRDNRSVNACPGSGWVRVESHQWPQIRREEAWTDSTHPISGLAHIVFHLSPKPQHPNPLPRQSGRTLPRANNRREPIMPGGDPTFAEQSMHGSYCGRVEQLRALTV